MNGRIYDQTLGRFLQADPHIQSPSNSQSMNRYSYVLNNPLAYTDPSGFFFKKLKKFLKKWWKPILAIAISVITYGAASGWAVGWGLTTTTTYGTAIIAGNTISLSVTTLSVGGYIAAWAIAGAVGGAVGGALITGSLKGALRGALTGAIAGAFGGWANTFSFSSFSGAASSIGVSAAGGCLAGMASGGQCREGAKLAAVSQTLKIGLDNIAEASSSWKVSEGEAVVKPDGKLKIKYLKEGKKVDWLTNEVDNTGLGVTVRELKYEGLIGKTVSEAKEWLIKEGIPPKSALDGLGPLGESGKVMSSLSQNIPGVRSSSVFHDRMVGLIERNLGMEKTWYGTVFTVGSIPPAFYAQYSALGVYSYDYYYQNLKR